MDSEPLQKQIKTCEDQKNSAHSWLGQIESFQHQLAAAQLQLDNRTLDLERRETIVRKREHAVDLQVEKIRADAAEKERVQVEVTSRKYKEIEATMLKSSVRDLLLGVIAGEYTMNVMNLVELPEQFKLVPSLTTYSYEYEAPCCVRMIIRPNGALANGVKIACKYEIFFGEPRLDDLVMTKTPNGAPTLLLQREWLTRNDKMEEVQVLPTGPKKVIRSKATPGPNSFKPTPGIQKRARVDTFGTHK